MSVLSHSVILLSCLVLAAPVTAAVPTAVAAVSTAPSSERQMVTKIERSAARVAGSYRRVRHLREPLIKNCINDKLTLIRGHQRLARQDLKRLEAARRGGRTHRTARVRLSKAFLQVTMAAREARQCRWLLGLSPGTRGRTVVKVEVHRSIPRGDPTAR
jgi:hypothetical protein